MLEGTSAMLRVNLDAAQAVSGVRVEYVVSSGGPTRNRLWNELDAAAAGVPLIVAPRSNAAIGSALIAAEAIGGCDDALTAGRTLRGAGEEVVPDPVLADSTASRFALSHDLSEASLPLLRRLGDERRGGGSQAR